MGGGYPRALSGKACDLLPPLPPFSCGSGLSGDFISEEGHYWIGMDISPAMLGEWSLLPFSAHFTSEVIAEVVNLVL